MIASNIDDLRKIYSEIRAKAYKNQMKKVKYDEIKAYEKNADEQLQKMAKDGDFTNLEEADFYKDKFSQVRKAYQNGSKEKLTWGKLTAVIQEILKQNTYASRNSVQGMKQTQSRIHQQTNPKNQENLQNTQNSQINKSSSSKMKSSQMLISSFFSQKKTQHPHQITFKNLLQTTPISNRTFKKKIVSNNQQMVRLRNDNYELRRRLQIMYPNGGGQAQNQQIRRIQDQLRRLQTQNQQLSRQNNRLKTEAGSSIGSFPNSNFTIEQMLLTPYLFFTRDNDLQKINARNSQSDGLSSYFPGRDQQFDGNRFSFKDQKGEALSQIQQSRNQFGNSFSLYEMSKSYFSEAGYGNPDQSYRLGIQNDHTAKKNKAAFFKDSGVLVRDQNIDIAYKKVVDKMFSDNVVKLYIYVSNKINSTQKIDIQYDYETPYFDINVMKKLTELQNFKQGRQAIQVRLKQNRKDLNSHATAIIKVGDKAYKIWVPILFMKFQKYSMNSNTYVPKHGTENSRKITPANIFSSPESAFRVIPMLQFEGNTGVLWGRSKDQSGPITLIWKKGNFLEILTKITWLDAVSFIFLEYQ